MRLNNVKTIIYYKFETDLMSLELQVINYIKYKISTICNISFVPSCLLQCFTFVYKKRST